MVSDRVQRRIERLLNEAEQALDTDDWEQARRLAQQVLALDEANADARAFVQAAERMLGISEESRTEAVPSSPAASGSTTPAPPVGARSIAPVPPLPLGRTGSPQEREGRGEGTPAATQPSAFANGRYQVKKFLGEGGKKKVYLAHDTLLDRDVAFALIKTEGLDDAGRQRLTREAQAMGRLGDHPHIVAVYDLGTEPPLPPERL